MNDESRELMELRDENIRIRRNKTAIAKQIEHGRSKPEGSTRHTGAQLRRNEWRNQSRSKRRNKNRSTKSRRSGVSSRDQVDKTSSEISEEDNGITDE